METVKVNAEALRKLLMAVNGPPHYIRELQVTRGLLGEDNAIDILVKEFNGAVEAANSETATPDITSPWNPITDPQHLRILGKLGEEATELGSALFRSIIQGLDEREPVTGKPNREWVEEELADVQSNINFYKVTLGVNIDKFNARVARKSELLRKWHEMVS